MCMYICSIVSNSMTSWTVAHQSPLSMGFSRQKYWSGLPFPSPGDLLTQGLNPCPLGLLNWQVDSLPAELSGKSSVTEGHMFYKRTVT